MKHKKHNNKESHKNHTSKNISQMNLGEEIDDKIHKFTTLFRHNNEESKNLDNSFSSDENDEYYDNFLQLIENNMDPNSIKSKNLKKKKKSKDYLNKNNKIENKKLLSLLKKSIMKPKENINNNHEINKILSPINEEKQGNKILKKDNNKLHPILLNKDETINQNYQNKKNTISSKENTNNERDTYKESYILNDMKNDKSLVLGNLNIRNIRIKNSLTPILKITKNNYNKNNISSIKTKKSPYKGYDNSFISAIKNCRSEKLKKRFSLKNEEKVFDNSLEEASGVNFKQNYNFNPTKISVENLTLKNNKPNKNNNNHIKNKDEEKNSNIQTPSSDSLKITSKRKCLFCCLPIY